MCSRLTATRTTSLLIAGLAAVLAIVGIVWLIVPIQAGPFYYRESILDTDGLGVLPLLFVPLMIVLSGLVALYKWMTLDSARAKWVTWLVAIGFLVACLLDMGVGPFFLPSALSLTLATTVWGISARNRRRL